MGPKFFETMIGRKFLEGVIPQMLLELKRLNDNLKRLNDNLERSAVSDDEGSDEGVD